MFGFFKRKKLQAHDTVANDAKRLINESTPFAVREAYRSLCTNVLYLPIDDKCKKICVTSAFAGEGKTSVSVNFALTLAQHSDNIRVLLIDSDMRKSRTSQLLLDKGIDTHGLSEYLAGIDDEPNIVTTSTPNFSILTSGAETVNPVGLLNSTNMKTLISILEERFDYIIFDTPPVNVVSDAIVLNEFVNGYLIVVRADYSDVRSVGAAINSLGQVDAEIFGIVLDSINLKKKRKYYLSKRNYESYSTEYGRKTYSQKPGNKDLENK